MFKIKEIYEIEKGNKNYPKQLLQIEKPPEKLYVIGNIELLQKKAIGIVGTRDSTQYGEEYAKRFASKLSKAGITIISGLAIGIDSIAHKNAMKNKGRTIAVIGSGFQYIFPEENKELFYEILENKGCIISEYPPNTKVKMSNFPIRNRIIAGISSGVLVVEAKFRSGSSITATDAFKQKKPVFCIPNQIGVKTGVGTNNLIKIGAKLVTNVNEILLEIGENEVEEQEEEIKKESKRPIKVEEKYKTIYQALEKGEINRDELTKLVKEDIRQINQKITMMEIEGLIETLPGNMVKRKE